MSKPLTSFLHLPTIWRSVAPSLPAARSSSTVPPEYAESLANVYCLIRLAYTALLPSEQNCSLTAWRLKTSLH